MEKVWDWCYNVPMGLVVPLELYKNIGKFSSWKTSMSGHLLHPVGECRPSSGRY